jgi:hypothetical protein
MPAAVSTSAAAENGRGLCQARRTGNPACGQRASTALASANVIGGHDGASSAVPMPWT